MTYFDRLSDRIFDQIWKKPSVTLPSVVYHYTNAAGLAGILESKRVWATDCRSLNDETESQLGVIKAREIARSRLLRLKNQRLRKFYSAFGEYLRTDDADRNFVFSLSEKRDDLTQWRAYARDGRGFTVGFETARLIANSRPELNRYGFSQVSYNAKHHELEVRKTIDLWEEKISEATVSGDKLNTLIDEAAMLDWVVSSQSVLFKHSSFQSEREWRINTYFSDDDPNSPIKVRAVGERLVPYMELKLCSDDENCLPISRIGVGPGFRDSGIRFAVEKLCEQSGFEVEIYNADTPYRRL